MTALAALAAANGQSQHCPGNNSLTHCASERQQIITHFSSFVANCLTGELMLCLFGMWQKAKWSAMTHTHFCSGLHADIAAWCFNWTAMTPKPISSRNEFIICVTNEPIPGCWKRLHLNICLLTRKKAVAALSSKPDLLETNKTNGSPKTCAWNSDKFDVLISRLLHKPKLCLEFFKISVFLPFKLLLSTRTCPLTGWICREKITAKFILPSEKHPNTFWLIALRSFEQFVHKCLCGSFQIEFCIAKSWQAQQCHWFPTNLLHTAEHGVHRVARHPQWVIQDSKFEWHNVVQCWMVTSNNAHESQDLRCVATRAATWTWLGWNLNAMRWIHWETKCIQKLSQRTFKWAIAGLERCKLISRCARIILRWNFESKKIETALEWKWCTTEELMQSTFLSAAVALQFCVTRTTLFVFALLSLCHKSAGLSSKWFPTICVASVMHQLFIFSLVIASFLSSQANNHVIFWWKLILFVLTWAHNKCDTIQKHCARVRSTNDHANLFSALHKRTQCQKKTHHPDCDDWPSGDLSRFHGCAKQTIPSADESVDDQRVSSARCHTSSFHRCNVCMSDVCPEAMWWPTCRNHFFFLSRALNLETILTIHCKSVTLCCSTQSWCAVWVCRSMHCHWKFHNNFFFCVLFLLKTNLNKMTVRADWSRPMMSGQHNVLHDQAKQDIVQPGLKQLRNSPLQPNWQDVLQTWPVSIVFCNIWIVHLSLVNAHIDVLLIKSICFRPKRAAWLRPCQLSAFWRDGCTNNFSFSFKFISIVFFPHWTSRWFERRLQTHCLMSMRVWVLHSSDN